MSDNVNTCTEVKQKSPHNLFIIAFSQPIISVSAVFALNRTNYTGLILKKA
jgi:hypothetical protein